MRSSAKTLLPSVTATRTQGQADELADRLALIDR